MNEQRKVWAEKGVAKRQKRKEWRRSSGRHMNEAISERKQANDPGDGHSVQVEHFSAPTLRKQCVAESITPKLHWLCCHLTEFARRRRWFALVSEQCIEHIHSHFDRLAPRYKNTGSEEKTMMKLARHQAILNSLHALGHEDEGRNSDDNEPPTPIPDENDPPRGRRMTQ